MSREEFKIYFDIHLMLAHEYLTPRVYRKKYNIWDAKEVLKELTALAHKRCFEKTQFDKIHTEQDVKTVICCQARDVFVQYWRDRSVRAKYVYELKDKYNLRCQESHIQDIEQKNLLAFLRAHLNKQDYELFYFKVIEGYKYKELTDYFVKNEVALRVQFSRVKKKISEFISKENV